MLSISWTVMEAVRDRLEGVNPLDTMYEIPIFASLFYYSIAIVTGRTLRAIISQNINTRWQPYLLNAVTTFQVMACSLENGHIRHFYGDFAYWLILATLTGWSVLTIKDSSANPCAQLLLYMRGALTSKQLLLRVLFQLAGGLLSFQFARQFWRMGLHSGHIERYESLHCVTHLSVSPPLGFTVEFSFALFDVIACLATFTSFHRCETASKIFVGCYLVLIGVHMTGMYANPINATNQSFGCRGTTIPEHVFVYWAAPLLATIVGFRSHEYITQTRRNRQHQQHKQQKKESQTSNGLSTTNAVKSSGNDNLSGSITDENSNIKYNVDDKNKNVRARRYPARTKKT